MRKHSERKRFVRTPFVRKRFVRKRFVSASKIIDDMYKLNVFIVFDHLLILTIFICYISRCF